MRESYKTVTRTIVPDKMPPCYTINVKNLSLKISIRTTWISRTT